MSITGGILNRANRIDDNLKRAKDLLGLIVNKYIESERTEKDKDKLLEQRDELMKMFPGFAYMVESSIESVIGKFNDRK